MVTAAFARNSQVTDHRTLRLSEMRASVARFKERVKAAQSAKHTWPRSEHSAAVLRCAQFLD